MIFLDRVNFLPFTRKRPHAVANLQGSPDYPSIGGVAEFYQTKAGVVVCVYAAGLPTCGVCENPVFAMHIHSGGRCSGNEEDYFADALTHYNPNNCPHPYHAGDMPPLFGVKGNALSVFLTNRFSVQEVIGRAVVIHAQPDDFTTQPAGNSGEKIACGIITRVRMI